jgi:mannitol operon transcriptional antiterminator
MPFGQPLTRLTHSSGLTFTMADDAGLLPVVEQARQITARWDVQRMFGHVAYAEAQLGGRFSDDAVLYLALFFAIQVARVDRGHFTTVTTTAVANNGSTQSVGNGLLHWLSQRPVWSVAEELANRLRWGVGKPWPEDEIAAIAMYLLAAPRNERWPGDLAIDDARGGSFADLLERLMQHISKAYSLPTLQQDRTLRDGIIVQAVPAYLRQRFRLWIPDSRADATLSKEYKFEHRLANELARQIEDELGARLPTADINNLALLLRAAYIRERAYQLDDVIVVCPSGMATAQLLVARLKARFPRLGEPRVLSIRDLTPQRVATADLVITIESLSSLAINEDAPGEHNNIIHVHPLLLPEDVEAITTWLASR